MTAGGSGRETLRDRLATQIDEALRLSDQLGMLRVGCHLQMARDLVGEAAWQPTPAQSPPTTGEPPWPQAEGPDRPPPARS
jgi:hypothetical protein